MAKPETSADPAVPGPSNQATGTKAGPSKAVVASQSKTTKIQPKGAAGQSKESKLKKPKTIQDDPNASEVFKSIFTSHHTAKNQVKAHWVSCDPFYF